MALNDMLGLGAWRMGLGYTEKFFHGKHCRRRHPLICKQFPTKMLVMFCEKKHLDIRFQACRFAVVDCCHWLRLSRLLFTDTKQ